MTSKKNSAKTQKHLITTALQIAAALQLDILPRGEIRREARKEIAKRIRKLLKDLGIKGVSVTAPNYSMAQSVDVQLPSAEGIAHNHHISGRIDDCAICAIKREAQEGIEKVILAAYPDLDNRSDYSTDYFDYKLSIS